jgi:hypothetical protein
MEARYQLRQSPMRAGLRPVHNLTDLTVEASTGLIIKVRKPGASRCAVGLLQAHVASIRWELHSSGISDLSATREM